MKPFDVKVSYLLIASIILILSLNRASAYEEPTQAPVIKTEIVAKRIDPKAEILSAYFAKHNSPLQSHAQDFIDAANTYNLDWRLVTAISGVESTFGKFIPGGYNGWGWGVYGTQAIYFSSWREAIFTVSQGLRENYIDKGLSEPYSMNRIYAESPYWGRKVSFFMNDLERFAQSFEAKDISEAFVSVETKIAADSGLLI